MKNNIQTPWLDKLIDFVLIKKAAGLISEEVIPELKQLLTNQTLELVSKIDVVTVNSVARRVKTKERWIGFGLGIIASIVISLVGYVIYVDYIK